MGCCSSSQTQPPAGRGAFPAPLPPPMQDNMNELLNRWRHGEVNLLQRRFRLARTQSVKPTMAAKLRSSLVPPSSGSVTATSVATSNNRDNSVGEDGSTSPLSGEDAEVGGGEQRKQAAEGTLAMLGVNGGGGGIEAAGGELGGGGSSRAGMDKEAFFRVFPEVQSLPTDVQKSAFGLFDCVGRGALDFRNFCRALALCCRGSRVERLRFLFDLFSGASQTKYYGTGADTGPKDAPLTALGGAAAVLSEAELGVLKKHLGFSPADADPLPFQTRASKAAGAVVQSVGEGNPVSKGLQLLEYFEWAEIFISDEALDKALRPFYLLPSPQQEKDKVLAHLAEHHMQEGQWMCLVATPWWAYWCTYAGLTAEDLERVPERFALGLTEAAEINASQLASATARTVGAASGQSSVAKTKVAAATVGTSGSNERTVASGDSTVAYGASGYVDANGYGGQLESVRVKDREVPAVLARRPHEMDNSILQGGAEWEVAPDQEPGLHYVLLPKLVWDVMVDWYGGGPVFCRQVVRVTSSTSQTGLPRPATADEGEFHGGTLAGSLTVDLYPLALHVNLCDASGRAGGRERLVLTSHYVTVEDMLEDILASPRLGGLQRGMTSGRALPIPDQDGASRDGHGRVRGGRDKGNDDEKDKGHSGDRSQATGDALAENADDEALRSRLWVLEISPSGLTDTPRAHHASAAGVCRPRFSFVGGGMMGGIDPQAGISRWKMVKPDEEHMTLSELGLYGGEKVMIETKSGDGVWPRHRYIEEPGFRHFREGARVDAMDYQGRWFRGQVVEMQFRSSSRIIDSEGPVGRKTKPNRHPTRPHTHSTASADEDELALAGAIQENGSGSVSSGVGGSATAAVATAAKMAQIRSGSGSQQQHQHGGDGSGTRRGGGEGGSGGGGGGTSRKRMRVRVHFDRFAPQWDEWYDSKSLKLAPEISYTAPVVPAQAVLKAREREEGAAEAEGEEDLSPNPPSNKSGAQSNTSSNSSRPGNGAYQPPVARFPGENGQWNSQQHPRAVGYGTPRSHGNGNADGLSNNVGGALNRRSNTPGRPPVAGACGLVNLGNTCYLNSAVQCLSHTPLMRAYLLSDMWAAEVNKYNPLGTQGKLVEDFAQLLKSLWSQEFLCMYPRKFKQGLVKYKPQFSGNEQQDSQEFLAEMLDALHEDVNRVIDKPYVAAPDDDEADSGKSDQLLADEAWDRHVQRNRSVIVDLFQGQLKMECRCQDCGRKSVTFDPFMYLSVPIPIRNEKMVAVVLLPRIRTRDIVGSGTGGNAGEHGADGEAMEFSNPRQLVPVRYRMMLPRLGEVSDLKLELSALCGLSPSSLVVSLMQQPTGRVLDDREPLNAVRDGDFILAFAVGSSAMADRRASSTVPDAATVRTVLPAAGELGTTASAEQAHGGEQSLPVVNMSAQVGNGTRYSAPKTVLGVDAGTVHKAPDANANLAEEGTGMGIMVGRAATGGDTETGPNGSGNRKTTMGTTHAMETQADLTAAAAAAAAAADINGGYGTEDEADTDLDDDRPPTCKVDRRSPDERCMGTFPSRLQDMEIGWRLDARDTKGDWFPATVVEIDPQGKRRRRDDKSSSSSSNRSPTSPPRSSKRTELLLKVHFDDYTSRWDEQYGEPEWKEEKLAPLYSKTRPAERILEIPIVHCRTHRAAAASARNSSNRDSSYDLTQEGNDSVRSMRETQAQGGGHVKEKHLFGLRFHVRCPPRSSARYLWRLVVQQASRFVAGSNSGRGFKAGMGDKMAKAAAGASKRPQVTAAWVARAAVGLESGITDERLAELLPFTIKIVLKQNPLSDVGAMELKPDKWRTASSVMCSKLILALEWKDGGRDYLDVLTGIFDYPSCIELENTQSVLSGLTLEQCLDAYTREETLEEEDSWYCSNCQAHRKGIMKIDLWKMPDVLVIHIKRFHCSARWREKIKTLVLFPHSGLDMSGFVSSNSAHRNQAGGGQGGMVYDLYGVVNHMGGMTGGHYTACCRSSPCSKDGVEEVTGWGLEHPWLNFDDEFVEEMAPDKIVSEAAYVLFYRRRRLTPSNVINMTI